MIATSVDDKGPRVIAAAVSVIVIQVIVVILRFWSRAISTRARFWWDDWMVLAALPCSLTLCAVVLYWVHIGFGRHLQDVLASGTTARQIDIMVFSTDFPYNTGITLVKLSALFFYARVFRVFPVFKRYLWITGALVISWWITFDVLAICTCNPPRKQWDTSIKGHCLDSTSTFVAAATPNVLIDLIILILPLPMLRKLQVSLRRKIALAGAFAVGYCVVVVSIIRLVTIIDFEKTGGKDITWNFVEPQLLIIVEIPLAIISVCMPSIFHLFKRGFNHGVPSLFSSQDPSKSPRGQHGEHIGPLGLVDADVRRFERLVDGKDVQSRERLVSQTIATRTSDTISQDVPLDDIQVRREVNVQIDQPRGHYVKDKAGLF